MPKNSPEYLRLQSLRSSLENTVLGQAEAVDLALIALVAGGHVLLEGPPGVGKTSLAHGIASGFRAVFRRVQMTSDLLPSDIVGTLRLRPGAHELEFRPGPIFCNVLLADELNRSSAKTQSALLEAMAEGKVSVDGVSHPLPHPFFVLATQNPQEFQGVYPLSESQLDRFMMHISLDIPAAAAELKLLQRYGEGKGAPDKSFEPLDPNDLLTLREARQTIFLEASLAAYAQRIAQEIRTSADIAHGASVRAILQLIDAAKARALLDGREFVVPADLKALAPAVLGHRLCVRGPSLSNQQRKELVRDAVDRLAIPS